ncbi:GNAT family N-acetyltransferase [Rhodobacteraceae bacterium N5(2021)]|uniref:GNAT family N-acetyltransferase n=1 Tax=Gymnodinialimonas phycosphaerae TaxID=2841589 RepID=A0A975YGE2_9RHOB|nr:GNAT family N-acetyltransferase [Gymnodinialimonas phycosphaerae]MBY4891587.1 GNAT family N-acetyltransferase [Gymnodinialimonas phycosphaerae]
MFDFSSEPLRAATPRQFAVPQPGVLTTGAVPLQQTMLWLEATRLLGSDAAMVDIGTRRALVLRRKLPVVGDMALLSRAELKVSRDEAMGLRDRLRAQHLVVNAETAADADALADAGFHRIFAPRVMAELPLDPSPDVMAARLNQKWRNRLRHGQAQGLVIRRRPMPPDKKFWLFKAEALQSLRKWYQPLPPEMIAAMAACKPGAVQVFTAYHLGRRVAAMLFLRHGKDATYQIGWSTPEGRRLSAGPACMWRAMVELQAMGAEQIDLGAADKDLAPGLAHFKRGTGAELRTLGGTWIDTTWTRRKHQRRLRQAA